MSFLSNVLISCNTSSKRPAQISSHAVRARREKRSSVQCSESLLTLAERELAALFSAVNEVFGLDEAQRAVEDWIAKLQMMDWPLDGTIPD
jgi:hypothetical protein